MATLITPSIGITAVYADEVIQSPLTSLALPQLKNGLRGQLRARQFTIISAGLSGKLISFPVTHGQRIKKGQKIATFDCRAEMAEKAVILARLNAAENKLAVNTKLASYKNISLLEVTLAKSEVAIQKAELKKTEVMLADCTITAPFSAIISNKIAQAHQYIKEGDPLLELVDSSSLEIEMVIPSKRLKKTPKGTQFSIQLDEVNTPINAKIDRHVGMIDPVSQTIRIIGKLIRPPKNLLPGMSGEVTFTAVKSSSNVSNKEK
ncbi:MAG: efflux RND transporter periplasmic adaptor subunit [Methylococcales bacterium]|nr:efflux RND transporter periplasmic adaptor subunit [Methylococcales bacterium]